MKYYYIILTVCLLLSSCKREEVVKEEKTAIPSSLSIPDCEGPAVTMGRVYVEDNKKWLWGGDTEGWDFDITGWDLNECQLSSGSSGREMFKALITPQFGTIEEENPHYNDEDICIVIHTNSGEKVYPYELLVTHEVINDVVDGNPVAIAYCVLADLGAVYERVYANKEFTFALSGYTYHDDEIWGGLDAFVFWDRETESLWWPLIDRAVSGLMKEKGFYLEKHEESLWEDRIKWSKIKNLYPDAEILKEGQRMEIPTNWERYTAEDF